MIGAEHRLPAVCGGLAHQPRRSVVPQRRRSLQQMGRSAAGDGTCAQPAAGHAVRPRGLLHSRSALSGRRVPPQPSWHAAIPGQPEPQLRSCRPTILARSDSGMFQRSYWFISPLAAWERGSAQRRGEGLRFIAAPPPAPATRQNHSSHSSPQSPDRAGRADAHSAPGLSHPAGTQPAPGCSPPVC